MIEHTCRESYFDAIKVDWNWYVFRFCEISTLPLLHSSLRSSTFFFCCHPCSRSDPFSSSVSALQCKCCCTERLSRTVSPTDARQWRLAGTNCCRWEYSRRTLQDTMYSSLPRCQAEQQRIGPDSSAKDFYPDSRHDVLVVKWHCNGDVSLKWHTWK